MNTKYIVIGCIAAIVGVYYAGYKHADTNWELRFKDFETQSERAYNDLLKQKIEADQANREKVALIEADHVQQLKVQKENYEKDIVALRANFKPSRVFKCPSSGDGMPRTGGDSAGLICYTRSELQRKIEETVAIGYECDQLAVKYNSLLKMLNE